MKQGVNLFQPEFKFDNPQGNPKPKNTPPKENHNKIQNRNPTRQTQAKRPHIRNPTKTKATPSKNQPTAQHKSKTTKYN